MMGPGINRLIAVQHDYTMGDLGVFGRASQHAFPRGNRSESATAGKHQRWCAFAATIARKAAPVLEFSLAGTTQAASRDSEHGIIRDH